MITIRLVAAFILSLLATLILFPAFIKKMQTLQYGQQIREDGPSRHLAKKGTPTMGGVIIILAAAIVSLILAGFSITLIAAVAVFAGCGSIGFMDDYLKVVKNRSLGLRARSKLAGEVIVALILIILVFAAGVYNPELTIPFTGATIKLGMLYPLFILVIVFSATNAVNLTDGIDGLAGGLSVIAFTAFSYIAYRYGSIELALFCATLAGSCLGFLFYNHHPARIFMGDAGSLALGGAFAAVAVLTKTELLLF
jgi:phospho-N-acetylmuramoyl-pentapeptide-transferase